MSSSSGHSSKYSMFESLAKGLFSSSSSSSSAASHGAPGTQPAAASAGASTTVSSGSGHSSGQKGMSLTDCLPLVEGASRRVMARKSAGAAITSEEVMKAFNEELLHQLGSGGMASMMGGGSKGGKGVPAGAAAAGHGAGAPSGGSAVPGTPVPQAGGSGGSSGIPGLGGPLPGPLAGHDKEVNMACNMLLKHYKLPPVPMAATAPATAGSGLPQAAGASAGMSGAAVSGLPVPHATGGYPSAGYGAMPPQAGPGGMGGWPSSAAPAGYPGYPPQAAASTMFPQVPPQFPVAGYAPDTGAMYGQMPYAGGVPYPYGDPMAMGSSYPGYPPAQATGSYPAAAYGQQPAAGQAYPGGGTYYAASPGVLLASRAAGGRVIVTHTGPLTRDHDDVRRVSEAVARGLKRAAAAGARRPVLLLHESVLAGGKPAFANAPLVGLIAAAGATAAPLSVRLRGGRADALDEVLVAPIGALPSGARLEELVAQASAVEKGRALARDVGQGDPEIMAPPAAAAHIAAAFAGTEVRVEVVEDDAVIRREYPLLHAVARASVGVPRHAPRVVHLVYERRAADGSLAADLYLVGKGVTYDTGGADVKTGGSMAGMSRDKCGAAVAAGVLASIASLRPAGMRVTALLGLVRNSVGSEAYVSDEIIVSHGGARVLVRNTDAEGRMVLADLLSHARVAATAAAGAAAAGGAAAGPLPSIMTLATLTGHAMVAVGAGYSIAVANGPARAAGVDAGLAATGEALGDPWEISHLRREDFDFIAPKTAEYDVLQCNNASSVATPRGHQFPAAFMLIASGLDKHGADSAAPIAYTHCDIGGAAVAAPFVEGVVTGQPVTSIVGRYVLGL